LWAILKAMSTDQLLLLRLVERNLSLHLLEDAKFYAERLYYESGGTQEALNILAQCYFRQNKIKQCYLVLQGCTLSANRYLLATCCFSLGKMEEAEATLMHHVGASVPSLQAAAHVPGGAAGLYLLGCICRRGHRKEVAIQYLKLSLQVGPVCVCVGRTTSRASPTSLTPSPSPSPSPSPRSIPFSGVPSQSSATWASL